ncbi:MAG: hypothetical protein IPL75_12820 [Acidobacteria bacterium]|nr:hypothetical protein [Acidobacteriota bacterium]
MALRDAVLRAGVIPPDTAAQADKKAYSEQLSHQLAIEVADSLRSLEFESIKPQRHLVVKGKKKGQIQIVKEKEFQGGLGPKRVDVSYSDDRHGLMLAVTIKSLNFPSFPKIKGSKTEFDYSGKGNFSKNIKNRFGDLTTESITLHLRFPFAVVSCLYVMPVRSDQDKGSQMKTSTFQRAGRLYGTITGRRAYGDPAERFEDVTLMSYQPLTGDGTPEGVWVKLYSAGTMKPVSEEDYFLSLRELYNERNPHAMVGEPLDDDEVDFEEQPE